MVRTENAKRVVNWGAFALLGVILVLGISGAVPLGRLAPISIAICLAAGSFLLGTNIATQQG